VLVPFLLLLAAAGAHPSSLSRTRIRVTGALAEVELSFQALSLLEARPDLERTRDGFLDADEAAAARDAIGTYLLEHVRLVRVAGGREEPLSGQVLSLTPQDPAQVPVLDLQNVEARLRFEAPGPLEVLVLESLLFHETNPWHQDLTTLVWNDDAPVHHTFEGPETRWRFEPAHVRRPAVVAHALWLGVEHVLGLDLVAFVLVLLASARRARALAGLVTALAAAEALTLVLSAYGVVSVPVRFVALAVALAIAYVACDVLLRREARDAWLEAACFGLLHGLGFAGFLGKELAGEPLLASALFGFVVGVELALLAVAAAGVALAALVFRGRRVPEGAATGLVPRAVRLAVAVVVALAGFYGFLARAGWLPWR